MAIGKDETYVGDILNLLNMDKRVINDLMRNNTTNDVRMLRIIRKAGSIDDAGKSEAQYKLYKKMLDERLSREQLIEFVNKTTTKEQNTIMVTGRHRKFTDQRINLGESIIILFLKKRQIHNYVGRFIHT